MRALSLAVALAVVAAGAARAEPPRRILSLDQCADQYVLALAPDAELALSPRADDADSWLREAAAGRRQVRPSLEAAVAFQPDVVIRTWGGDARLLTAMERRGARIVEIPHVDDFAGARRNLVRVAEALGRPERAEPHLARMAQILDRPRQDRGSALYLTSGGFTSGSGTLIDAVLTAAGFANAAARPGFAAVSVERLALFPPARLVLGFFDLVHADWRGAGRHPVVARLARDRGAVSASAATLTCPAWFAVEAVAELETE